MKSLFFLILLVLMFDFGKPQNQNTSIEIINTGLEFDSAKIIADSITFDFTMKLQDTIMFIGFNPNILEFKKFNVLLYSNGKIFKADLKNDYNIYLNLSIEFKNCKVKWY